jgi:hypothetical protein
VRHLLPALLLATSATAAPAAADDSVQLVVAVGAKVEQAVGQAQTWFCDDPSLIHAELETRDGGNVWIVVGAKPGKTQCRVGQVALGPSYLFAVTVKPATKPRRGG